ncbi:MAG: DUF4494 domain-containing protein [Prevotella sp.]|nr:DUF4494 domain-containing protein [Prevotella sp.]
MRSRTTTWFETKVRYDKMMDDGLLKTASELYVVDALSFAEAEARMTDEMASLASGEFKITNIVEAAYKEAFFSDDAHDDRWFKAKLQFITFDENTEKEKRQTVYYLVQAGTLAKAVAYIDEVMSKTMIDYVIASVAETAVMDVFEHDLSAKTNK